MPKVEKSIERKKRTNKITLYFRETVGELKKVNWPTRREALNLTGIVLLVVIGMTAFLGLLDYTFTEFFALILS
ncbi:MAG: preprotein translocase subunit SecE [Anaerolineales bacterium]|nr:preprotein translocase subunit SecE [Anaerolineales bacterium]